MEWEGSRRFRRSSFAFPVGIDSLSSNELATEGARELVSDSGSSLEITIASSSTAPSFPLPLSSVPDTVIPRSTVRSPRPLCPCPFESMESFVEEESSGVEIE